MSRTRFRQIICILAIAVVAAAAATAGINAYVNRCGEKCFSDSAGLPYCDVAIILGAGVEGDRPSYYLKERLDTGIGLYNDGKVGRILLTGDDGGDQTDEISVMVRYCCDNGVAPADIIIDYKGYNTLASVRRAKTIFGIDRAIFVSQRYHLKRAVFIGERLGIESYGKAADSKELSVSRKYLVREYFANVKAFLFTLQ